LTKLSYAQRLRPPTNAFSVAAPASSPGALPETTTSSAPQVSPRIAELYLLASDEDRDRALLAAPPAPPPAERKPAEVDPEATPSPKRDSSLLTSVKKLFRK
jgi:hypothetical protein